jgi:hypothetical protein
MMLLGRRSFRRKPTIAFRTLLFRIRTVLATVAIGWSAEVSSQQAAICSSESNDLLRCARGLIDDLRREGANDPVILTQRLREPLEALASKESYDGSASDLNELKRLSSDLKVANKVTNYEAISLLDNAIASYASEIRSALSWRAIALKAEPGADIHAPFVSQKLDFLKSSKAAFYDDGPFDLVRRSLLAGALEDHYFMERSVGKDDRTDLLDELNIINDLINRYQNPEYDHLLGLQKKIQHGEINNQLFWKATIQFLLGNKSEMRDALSKLAILNLDFGLEIHDTSREVYSYRVFNEPYKIVVGTPVADNEPRVTIKDDNLIKRYFNAAQLALLMCGFVDDVGPTHTNVQAFKEAVTGLNFHDYFVVVAAEQAVDDVRRLEDAISRALDNEKLSGERKRKANAIVGESGPLSSAMQAGAQKCGVAADDRKRIYSPFEFRSQVKQIDGVWYLLFGGWLNAHQASDVAQFLKESVLPVARRLLPGSDGNDISPYVARRLVVN